MKKAAIVEIQFSALYDPAITGCGLNRHARSERQRTPMNVGLPDKGST